MIYTNLTKEELKRAIQTDIKIIQNDKYFETKSIFDEIDKKAYLLSVILNESVEHTKKVLYCLKLMSLQSDLK